MSEFKIGDYVVYDENYKYKNDNWYFKGAKQITNIHGNMVNLLKDGEVCYTKKELKLVCGFAKGQKIAVDGDFSSLRKRIFNQYRPELTSSFECVMEGYENEFKNGEKFEVYCYKNAKAIEYEYKKYKEPSKDWIGKVIKAKNYSADCIIEGFVFNGQWSLYLKNTKTGSKCKIGLRNLFENYIWEDGTPCGDLKEVK